MQFAFTNVLQVGEEKVFTKFSLRTKLIIMNIIYFTEIFSIFFCHQNALLALKTEPQLSKTTHTKDSLKAQDLLVFSTTFEMCSTPL